MFKMTPNILRNLFSHKATRRYPQQVRMPFENVRGELYNDIDKCRLCSVCAVKCPSQCITVDKKTATWTCDPFACLFCGICVDVCTEKCLHQKREYRIPGLERKVIRLEGKIRNDKSK